MENAIDTQLAQQLHDRATRGESFTAEEQRILEAWYAEQDAEERLWLEHTEPMPQLADLRAKLATASERLAVAVERVQSLTTQNEALSRELRALQHNLLQRSELQPA